MALNDPEKQIAKAVVALTKQDQDIIKRLILAEERIEALVKENYELSEQFKALEEKVELSTII